MTDLKRCPFCGSKDIRVWMKYESFFVQCEDCSALVPDPNTTEYTQEEAIEAWNRRYEPSEQARWLDGLD